MAHHVRVEAQQRVIGRVEHFGLAKALSRRSSPVLIPLSSTVA